MEYVDAFSEMEDDGSGERPWADLVFDMTSPQLSRGVGGALARVGFEARGSTEGGVIGFGASLQFDEWKAASGEDYPLFWGYVTLSSIGDPTDRLIEVYRRWWDLPALTGPTTLPLRLLAVGLGAHPADEGEEKAHVKLFFEPRKSLSRAIIRSTASCFSISAFKSVASGFLKKTHPIAVLFCPG